MAAAFPARMALGIGAQGFAREERSGAKKNSEAEACVPGGNAPRINHSAGSLFMLWPCVFLDIVARDQAEALPCRSNWAQRASDPTARQ